MKNIFLFAENSFKLFDYRIVHHNVLYIYFFFLFDNCLLWTLEGVYLLMPPTVIMALGLKASILIIVAGLKSCISYSRIVGCNPLTAKLFNLNFHPLEVMSR